MSPNPTRKRGIADRFRIIDAASTVFNEGHTNVADIARTEHKPRVTKSLAGIAPDTPFTIDAQVPSGFGDDGRERTQFRRKILHSHIVADTPLLSVSRNFFGGELASTHPVESSY